MLKAIIGLGNPGQKFSHTRHNIGFKVVDQLAARHGAKFTDTQDLTYSELIIDERRILLVKPQTFMNNSGRAIPFLLKKGIKPEEMLVVHDELEFPFGKLSFKMGGSARGHNGLKSIISVCGDNFMRLRFGIGRPEDKSDVPDYVLRPFTEKEATVEELIDKAADMIEDHLKI